MKYSSLLIIASLPLLAACHHDTRPDWQQAEPAPHLNIPAGVDTPGRSGEMTIPAAAGTVEGAVHDDTSPPTQVSMTSSQDTGEAWQTVTDRLKASGLGHVVSRDNQQYRLSLSIKGSQLPGPEGGFFSRMFSSKPDPQRDYFTLIDVDSENGQTMVNLNGDGRAVLYLGSVLQGKSLHFVESKGGSVSTKYQYNRVPTRSGAPDASGRQK